MQAGRKKAALHERALHPDQIGCPPMDQFTCAFNSAMEDRDCSNKLGVFEIDIVDNPGAYYLNPPEGNRLAPRRARQQVLQKAGGELAAIFLPARIVLVTGIERGGVAALVEVGRFVLPNLRPGPAFSGLYVVIAP